MKVYAVPVNLGDGSLAIWFFKTASLLTKLMQEDPETFLEESFLEELTFPHETDFESIGIKFYEDDVLAMRSL